MCLPMVIVDVVQRGIQICQDGKENAKWLEIEWRATIDKLRKRLEMVSSDYTFRLYTTGKRRNFGKRHGLTVKA